jgi:hypothetical protein
MLAQAIAVLEVGAGAARAVALFVEVVGAGEGQPFERFERGVVAIEVTHSFCFFRLTVGLKTPRACRSTSAPPAWQAPRYRSRAGAVGICSLAYLQRGGNRRSHGFPVAVQHRSPHILCCGTARRPGRSVDLSPLGSAYTEREGDKALIHLLIVTRYVTHVKRQTSLLCLALRVVVVIGCSWSSRQQQRPGAGASIPPALDFPGREA